MKCASCRKALKPNERVVPVSIVVARGSGNFVGNVDIEYVHLHCFNRYLGGS